MGILVGMNKNGSKHILGANQTGDVSFIRLATARLTIKINSPTIVPRTPDSFPL